MQLRSNSAIEKNGLNYVKNIVESSGCIFHQIQLENDYGIDAIIELAINGKLKAKLIAVQIKSGSSYCTKNRCKIKSDKKHFEYWSKYPLYVVGIVYDPNEKTAYWLDIQNSLKDENKVTNGPYTISVRKNDYTRFNEKSFQKFFVTALFGESLILDFEESFNYSKSKDLDMCHIGIYSLLRNHIRLRKTWTYLFKLFRTRPSPGIHGNLIDLLSSLLDHHNMEWYSGRTRNLPFEHELIDEMKKFTKNDVTKMLSFIYEEDDFTRIHISKRINDILQLIPNHDEMLKEIIKDKTETILMRKSALMFLACKEQRKVLSYLKTICNQYPELKDRISYIRSFFTKGNDEMYCFD